MLLLCVCCCCCCCCLQLDQLKSEKAKLHKEKVDLENQLEAEQVWVDSCQAPFVNPLCAAASSLAV
jgi:hypothetical protein